MAFTRKFLSALGIEADKIDEIIASHVEVTENLKNQIADLKTKSEEVESLRKQLDETNKSLKEANEKITATEKDDYKGKYASVTEELEKLKADVATKETVAKKESAIKAEGKSRKYSESAIKVLLDSRKNYIDKLELDDKGNAKNLDDIFKSFDNDYSDFKPHIEESQHSPQNPPSNQGGKATKTKADIMAIKDATERQAAIKESIESGSTDFKV